MRNTRDMLPDGNVNRKFISYRNFACKIISSLSVTKTYRVNEVGISQNKKESKDKSCTVKDSKKAISLLQSEIAFNFNLYTLLLTIYAQKSLLIF